MSKLKVLENVNVTDLESITNVFLARYEQNLLRERDRFQKEINQIKRSRDKVEKDLETRGRAELDKELGAVNLGTFQSDLEIVVESVNLARPGKKGDPSYVSCTVVLRPADADEDTYYGRIDFERKYLDNDPQFKVLDDLEKDQESLRGQLTKVYEELTQITRKERAIRGKIAEKKLGADFEELLNDTDLSELITLKLEG